MARPSRSSRKQPEFDPRELDDLIMTPAVGRGVGSHLFPAPEDPATVADSHVTTVDIARSAAPEATSESPTVADSKSATEAEAVSPSVDITDMASVRSTEKAPVDILTPVVVSQTPTETAFQTTSVAVPDPTTVAISRVWVSDSGEVVPAARVRLLRHAAEALTPAERAVFDTLRSAPALIEGPASRTVRAGYDYLVKSTGLSRKTIQRIVDRLIAKLFIDIDQPADMYQRLGTVYRVHSFESVMSRLTRQGSTRIAKIGPGVAFVHPWSDYK